MRSKKPVLSINVFLLACLLACFAVASVTAGCRSSNTQLPLDDEPGEKVGSIGEDASICNVDSAGPLTAAPATIPIGDEPGPVVLNPSDTCNEVGPVGEPSFLHEVWKRALEHFGPQDPAKPPSPETCETAKVLQRIGIAEAETILGRCPAESKRTSSARTSDARSALPLDLFRPKVEWRGRESATFRVRGRATGPLVAATEEWS